MQISDFTNGRFKTLKTFAKSSSQWLEVSKFMHTCAALGCALVTTVFSVPENRETSSGELKRNLFDGKEKESTLSFFGFIFFEVTKPEAFQKHKAQYRQSNFLTASPFETKLYAILNRKW